MQMKVPRQGTAPAPGPHSGARTDDGPESSARQHSHLKVKMNEMKVRGGGDDVDE